MSFFGFTITKCQNKSTCLKEKLFHLKLTQTEKNENAHGIYQGERIYNCEFDVRENEIKNLHLTPKHINSVFWSVQFSQLDGFRFMSKKL